MRRSFPIVFLSVLFGFFLSACADPAYQQIQGATMGTYYAVSAAPQDVCGVSQAQIDAELEAINAAMSTYLPDSELSRFNQLPADVWFTMSPSLAAVVQTANLLWQRSGGAFDVTIGPLVNLWGFGPPGSREPPSAEEQAQAHAVVGMQHLRFRQQGTQAQMAKATAGVYVDLSALAKGYAVDRVAELYASAGCLDFMVDIGGEIRAAGVNPRGEPWRIGVEVPDPQSLGVSQTVLALADASIATSGDYRNFRVVDGVRVDHLIDPRSGQPANNHVVSATVLHASAMWADAYATALMVMGMEQGLAFADQEGFAAYLIARQPLRDNRSSDGSTSSTRRVQSAGQTRLESRYNAAMANYLQ